MIKIVRDLYPNKENFCLIQCFPGQLNQVFVNLINNAIDAIEGNGEIKIQTINKSDNFVQLRISDTGFGMSKEVVAKIFDPFFTTKDIGKGTGLGLSISHGIIEKHKGTITVESKIGKDTTLIIDLSKKLEIDETILEENMKLG